MVSIVDATEMRIIQNRMLFSRNGYKKSNHLSRVLQTISPEPDTQPSESSEPTMPEEKTASDSESIPHLDINIATAEDFQKLPNVTPEQAEAIVRLRTQIQYFQNIYELLYADGMTDRLFLSIRDYLYVSFA